MTTYYLNTDLCLVSPADLTPFAQAMEGQLIVGYCGRHGRTWHAALSALGSGRIGKRQPRDDALRLLKACGSLRGTARSLWRGCTSREMNIGWQAAAARPEGAFHLDPAILAELSRLGIAVAVTIYPADENDLA